MTDVLFHPKSLWHFNLLTLFQGTKKNWEVTIIASQDAFPLYGFRNRIKIHTLSFLKHSLISSTDLEAKYSGNSIEDMPASVCNLVCLKSLSLNGNKIRQVCMEKLLN
jgi:hypothetical protein